MTIEFEANLSRTSPRSKVAEPLLRDIHDGRPDFIVSDCALASLQIEHGMGRKPLHPAQVLELAYGLAGDGV
jgi:Fe-S oxidoreductase